MRACLSELNKELRFSHLEIRGLNDKGTETYGIVNTVRALNGVDKPVWDDWPGVALTQYINACVGVCPTTGERRGGQVPRVPDEGLVRASFISFGAVVGASVFRGKGA